MKKEKGFTLLEVLLVIALIAILAGITFVALNPAKNLAEARNTERTTAVGEILSALIQYTQESGNSLSDFGTIADCPSTDAIGSDVGNIDLSSILVEEYITEMPIDPTIGSELDTGYTICITPGNRVTIAAPGAENGALISESK